jgi:hypothetical protein
MVVKTQSGWYWKKVDSRQVKVEREEEERDNAEARRALRDAEELAMGEGFIQQSAWAMRATIYS